MSCLTRQDIGTAPIFIKDNLLGMLSKLSPIACSPVQEGYYIKSACHDSMQCCIKFALLLEPRVSLRKLLWGASSLDQLS